MNLARLVVCCAVGAAIWALVAHYNQQPIPIYDRALADAKAGKKIVLADFTGSDWCGYCVQLKREVLDTAEFQTWARGKFVFLELDFPMQKVLLDDIKKQNRALYKKYSVNGFPTVILIDGEGRELGHVVGYGGKEEWMNEVRDILAKHGQ